MTNSIQQHNPFWDVQISIANAAARSARPSLSKLHQEILEEIGRPPDLDLIDYFISITDLKKQDIDKYLALRGRKKENNKQEHSNTSPGEKELADIIAAEQGPTVLKLRQAFIKEYGKPPSEQITSLFLQQVNKKSQTTPDNNKEAKLKLAESIACCSQPTVLKLRTEFIKQFGSPPDDDVTNHFLMKIREGANGKGKDEQFEIKVDFAKTIANGFAPTILQFRQAYEKTFGELPPDDITAVFIKYMK